MKKIAFVLTSLMFSINQAFAALPADVTTQLTESKTDGATLGAGVLVVVVAIAAFKWMRRAV